MQVLKSLQLVCKSSHFAAVSQLVKSSVPSGQWKRALRFRAGPSRTIHASHRFYLNPMPRLLNLRDHVVLQTRVFFSLHCHVACDLMNWLEFLLACTVMLLVILHATHGCRPCTCKKQSFVCAELTQCESYEIHELGMKWCTNIRFSR